MGLVSSKISNKTMVPLCRQLSTAFSAGLPITRSLTLVSDQVRNRRTKAVFSGLAESIQGGSTFGEALRAQRGYLPDFFVELLAAGEVGGRLDVMFKDLADYFEDRQEMQRKIVRSMIYPCFQLTAAWFLGTFALGLVKNLSLSRPDNILSRHFEAYARFQAISLTVFAVVAVICVVLARQGVFGWISGGVTTYLWPLSEVTRRFALARFFRSMALLIGSGLNIIDCIVRSARVTGNPYIARDLLKSVPLVKEGASLSQAFAGSYSLTKMAREMLAVGEESGNLDGALQKVAEYHLNEATHAVDIAVNVFNVAIAVGVALLVGYVVISFWTQYYGGMMNELGI